MPRPSQRQIALSFAVFLALIGGTRYLNSVSSPPGGLPGECQDSPNCASSADSRPAFHVEPIPLNLPVPEALETVRKIANTLPRWRLAQADHSVLHFEVRSRVFGFVDDVHLWIPPGGTSIHLRAASRVGFWDLGQNRRHLHSFMQAWTQAQGGTTGPTH